MTAMAPDASTGCAACSRSRYGTNATQRLFCARDRFGIKPFYYAVVGNLFVFASEAKALLPFLPEIATDPEALAEYLTFQYTIGERDAVPRRQAAAAGPCTDRREWRGASLALLGRPLRDRFRSQRPVFRAPPHRTARRHGRCSSAQRRAGRRLCFGRHRFEPDRDPGRQDRARRARVFSRPLHRVSGL